MPMDIEKVFGTALEELDKILNSKTVVGAPIVLEGKTVIPLVSVGFGFGAGGGEGTDPSGKSQGTGGGTGGGGGVRPVALIIIDKDGARLETIKGASASVLGAIAESVAKVATAREGEHATHT